MAAVLVYCAIVGIGKPKPWCLETGYRQKVVVQDLRDATGKEEISASFFGVRTDEPWEWRQRQGVYVLKGFRFQCEGSRDP